MRAAPILLVDDDPNILSGYQRQLRKQYKITTALGPVEGLEAVESKGAFAVIVADMRMPVMDGIEFLSKVKEMVPDSVRMMLTGQSDQETASQAINEGNIFRFLTKPCPTDLLSQALEAGVEQYRLIRAEKELLEKTLSGSVKVLIDVLSLVNPKAFGRASRLTRLVRQILEKLETENAWQIELSSMLSQLGCVTVPEETLDKKNRGKFLTKEEKELFEAHPQIGCDLISKIPRLENVAETILYQEKEFDGSGFPFDDRTGEDIPIGARILKLALDYDTLFLSGKSNADVLKIIYKKEGKYDPVVVEALKESIEDELKLTYESKIVRPNELTPNMILAEDVISDSGVLLVAKGQEVTPALCIRLTNFSVTAPIHVLVPGEKPASDKKK